MNLFALVKAGTTLLGQRPVRFFEFGTAPELMTLPYATWQELSGVPFNVLEGAPGADHIKTQIDVWAETPAACRAVAREIRRSIDGTGTVTFFSYAWDEPSRLYRAIIHFYFCQEL
jgi:hypothetical protein